MVRNLVYLLTIIGFGQWAYGATSGNLNLSGSVASFFNITVTAEAVASGLDISNGQSGTKVAEVNENSNSPGGYKITMYSSNGGKLVHSTVASQFVSYQIAYDGGSNTTPPLSSAPVTVKTSGALTTVANNTSDVNITFSGLSGALAGAYSDSVTFEISAP